MPLPLSAPDSVVGPFREEDSVVLRATLMDNAEPPVAIPGSALDTATLTLYLEKAPFPIINGRDGSNIKTSIDEQGRLVLPLAPADMAIQATTPVATEYHRALIEWTWNGGQRGSWEVRIIVRDVTHV